MNSGSRTGIDYAADIPALPLHRQEMLWEARTPTILNREFPLMIHRLSPARGAVQVIRNQERCWANSYQQACKELRIKYQKHYWRDDPASA
ncbi:ATP-dependent RNA helicase HrpB [Microbulbifer aestuariivivens]|uniref:ATP-dependent RNA helicase HrpB n=1 Tax=Microbulbifer aestuariivivens TaxID=1908308 RepID=A0ABP9WNA6_9GAMM